MFPLVEFGPIRMEEANAFLVRNSHKMGPRKRPKYGIGQEQAHGLKHDGQLVGVATTSRPIAPLIAGTYSRNDTVELSRLCADRAGLCRVLLRLWRVFVFEQLHDGIKHAISYQDASLHSGNTYRFDGWQRVARSRSGTDKRSGAVGRDKWIWVIDRGTP